MTENHDAIRGIIERQFGSLSWTAVSSPDCSAFERDFLPGASLYPAARPAKSQKPEEFVERMKGLAATRLVAVCEITENEAQVTRGIEMMLLVKTEGRWQIVSQAWDTEGVSKPIPADLLRSP
jgi:hypothetical protein